MPRHNSRLTLEQVDTIRAIAKMDRSVTQAELGRRYGVSQSCILNVINGLTYKDRAYTPDPKRRKAKLDWPMVRDIRRRYAEGEKGIVLAMEYGVSPVAIHFVTSGKHWCNDPAGFVWEPIPPRRGALPKLTPDDLARIAAEMKDATNLQVAVEYDVSEATISKVRNGKYYRRAA